MRNGKVNIVMVFLLLIIIDVIVIVIAVDHFSGIPLIMLFQ